MAKAATAAHVQVLRPQQITLFYYSCHRQCRTFTHQRIQHSTHPASYSVGQIVCVRERERERDGATVKVTLLSGLLCMALVAAKKVPTTKNMSQEHGKDGKNSNSTCPGLTSLTNHAVLFMPQTMLNIQTPTHPTEHAASQ